MTPRISRMTPRISRMTLDPWETLLGSLLGAFGAPLVSPKSPTMPKRIPKAAQMTPKSDLLQDLISKPVIVNWTPYLLCFVHVFSEYGPF